jgi:hypothetical protein
MHDPRSAAARAFEHIADTMLGSQPGSGNGKRKPKKSKK